MAEKQVKKPKKIKVKVIRAFVANGRHEIGEVLEIDEDTFKALGKRYVVKVKGDDTGDSNANGSENVSQNNK